MAATNGNARWEVVRKQPKKAKENAASAAAAAANNNKLTKTQVKEYLDKMPRLGQSVPLKESKTMFDAFLEKTQSIEKKSTKQQSATSKAANPSKNADANKQKKKNAEKKKLLAKAPQSLEESIKNLNMNELQTLMNMVQLRFPDSPNIWLKDLISYLNMKLNFDTQELGFKQKDYSLYILPEDLQLIIEDTLNHCSDQLLNKTFEQALSQMAEDITKGMKIHGHRIILQAIVQKKPEMYINILKTGVDLCKTYQTRAPVCLSIFWVIGQFGLNGFETGFKVWVELFHPFLGTRIYSRYVVEYIQALLSWHFEGIPKENAIEVPDFFLFLDTLYSASSNLDVHLYNELLAIYPKLKVLSFGTDPHEKLHKFFPSFLSRLKASCSHQLRSELLLSLITCLKMDDECYLIWRKIMANHIAQSSILLDHISKNYENIIPDLSKKLLRETLLDFLEIYKENSKKKSKNQQVAAASEGQQVTESLLLKIGSQSTFTFCNILAIIITIAIVFGIFDYQTSGSFQSSRMNQVFQRFNMQLYLQSAYSIGSQSLAFVQKACQPYFHILDASMGSFGKFLSEGIGRVDALIKDHLPSLLNLVDGWLPNALAAIGSYASVIWSLITHSTSLVWQFAHSIVS